MSLRSVVFPPPFGPIIPRISPGSTVMERLSRRGVPLYPKVRSFTSRGAASPCLAEAGRARSQPARNPRATRSSCRRVARRMTIPPLFITNTRGERGSSGARRCSTTIRVRPSRSRSSRRRLKTACAPSGSRLAVGSSRRIVSGAIARIDAIAKRCFSPPERVVVVRLARCVIPTKARHCSTRAATSLGGRQRFSGPNATSCHTLRVQICASGSC